MIGLFNHVPFLSDIFAGEFHRLLQAHIDFLLMSALLLGFYAARVPLPWHVSWAMAVGAFTNSSLFLLQAIFPSLDPASDSPQATGFISMLFHTYLFASLLTTTYGFGHASIHVFRSTLIRTHVTS